MVCGPVFFRQSWSAFWLVLAGWEGFLLWEVMLFAVRKYSLAGLSGMQKDCCALAKTSSMPGLNFTITCSLAPEGAWFFSCAVNNETIHIFCILYLPFVSLPIYPFSPSALFVFPHPSFPPSLLMSKICTSFHKRPWNLVQKCCQSCITK